MANPKGMRVVRLPVNSTDAVLTYGNEQHVWLQLRRNVKTVDDIGRSSFKVSLCLQPGTAEKLGKELLGFVERAKAARAATGRGNKGEAGSKGGSTSPSVRGDAAERQCSR